MNPMFLNNHAIELSIVLTGMIIFIALFLSHLKKRYIGITLFSSALMSAWYFNYVDLIGISVSFFYGFCCYHFSFKKRGIINAVLGLIIFIFSVLLLLHLMPGFNNAIVLDNIQVSDNAPPYSQYLNFDKALVGFFLLIYVVKSPIQISFEKFLVVVMAISLSYGIAVLLGVTTGLIGYDFKLPDYIISWVLINLFISVYAEEAFFRGFVQSSISSFIAEGKWKGSIVVVSSGLLFGLAHIPAGIVYATIASILGCAYAFGYMKTGNILVPIVGHFLFNLIHFTIFTYPYILQV